MSKKEITKEQKIYELSLIWKEAEYNFAFWDNLDKTFDWDKEYRKALDKVINTNNVHDYYLELMRFIALLKDGHTSVWFPEEIIYSKDYFSFLPIEVQFIDNKYVITNNDESLVDIISRYSIIKQINGMNIEKYIEDNIYPYIWHEKKDSSSHQTIAFLLRGKEGTSVSLSLDDGVKEYNVTINRIHKAMKYAYQKALFKYEDTKSLFSSKSHSIEFTKDDIAIITIDSMMNDELPNDIFNNFNILKKAKGYVIDIRHNSGGNSNNSDYVASLFIGSSFKNDNTYHPIHIGAYKAWGRYNDLDKMTEDEFYKKYKDNESFDFYEKMFKICHHTLFEESHYDKTISNVPGKLDGPIVLLISSDTASAAENFVNVMKYNANAVLVGSATYGSTGQPLNYNLESGGGFRICTRKSKALDKSDFINIGFKPDIECSLSIEDYKNSNDSVMKKGLEFIRNQLKNY